MPTRIGINGFGRIGRLSLRALLAKYKGQYDVVAVNDLTDTRTNAHLFKYDTTYGPYKGMVEHDDSSITIDGDRLKVFAEAEPANIPWNDVGAEIVIESTGRFTDANLAKAHLGKGVQKVVISAPAKNEDVTLVLGVNDHMYDPATHHVISNASCTTNGLAPVAKVLHEKFGIEKGILTTVHSYTNSQKTVDTAAKDLRDARAAAENIVPSSTGAAKAVGLVIPDLKGKFTGMAFRVPTRTVSVVDFTVVLSKEATPEQINSAMREYASGPMKGILAYTEEELVSSDLIGDENSSIFSAVDTIAIGNMAKVIAWYDNEWGYSCRIADLAEFLVKKGLKVGAAV
jgi:glyceraldehyde 3-phosphate dehydrogenase